MEIIAKKVLANEEIKQVKTLMNEIHSHDHTYSDPYLSNEYNYFSNMPAFILAYQNDLLVGFLMIYADDKPDEEIDLYIYVLPKFRQRKIATTLINRAKIILNKYGYSNFNYASEQRFLDEHPQFLGKTKLKIVDEEYNMRTQNPLANANDSRLKQDLRLCLLTKDKVKETAVLHSAAFDNDLTMSLNYLTQGLRNLNQFSFVLLYHNQIIGYCAADISKYAYFFGLFIAHKYCNRGFGTFFIKEMMYKLGKKGIKEFVLDVDINNIPAIKAYLAAGFEIKSENVYLKK